MVVIKTARFVYKRKNKKTFFLPPMGWFFICRDITLFIIHEMISPHLIMYKTLLILPMHIFLPSEERAMGKINYI